MMSGDLLIIANTPSANTLALAEATADGARRGGMESVCLRQPLQSGSAEVLAARAIIIGTTENFGYMSGLIKDFFERIYYPCLQKTPALPYALYVRAGKDGAGTLRGVGAITAGLRWREIQPPLLLQGDWSEPFVGECETLGMTVAAGLAAGIF